MKLLAVRDKNGVTIPVVPMSDYIDHRVLGAGTHEAHAVPSGMAFVCVTPSADLYLKRVADSFAAPAADITDGSGPLFIPAGASRLVQVANVESLGLISTSSCDVSLEWFE